MSELNWIWIKSKERIRTIYSLATMTLTLAPISHTSLSKQSVIAGERLSHLYMAI